MAGLIRSDILTNITKAPAWGQPAQAAQPAQPQPSQPQQPYGTGMDQWFGGMGTPQPAQNKPAPFSGAVASTPQALTNAPKPDLDWGAFTKFNEGRSQRVSFAPDTASPIPTSGAVAGNSQALGAYYDEGGYHPGTPDPQYGGHYDESGSYHPGSNEGSHDEAGWHPPKEATTSQVAGVPPITPFWEESKVSSGFDAGDRFSDYFGSKDTGEGADPWAMDFTPPRGELEDPGVQEVNAEQTKDWLQKGDPAMSALIDQLLGYGGPEAPDLDPWYDREWKRTQGDLNRQAAARGMYGSGDAQRMLHQSRESLAADQAKEEADYAMESWKTGIGRLGLAAQLQGGLSQDDINKYLARNTVSGGAQAAEERRLGGFIDDTLAAFNSAHPKIAAAFEGMSQADQEIAMEIIKSIPAEFLDQVNWEQAAHAKAEGGWAAFAKLVGGGGTAAPAAK